MSFRIGYAGFAALLIMMCAVSRAGFSADNDDTAGKDGKEVAERQSDAKGGASSGKRPGHALDISVNRFASNETGFRATLRDKLFTSDEMNFSNTISFDRREFNDRRAPDIPLYSVSATAAATDPDYFVIARGWSNSDKPFNNSSTIGGALLGAKRVYAEGNHSLYAAMFITTERYFRFRYPFPIPFISYQYKSEGLTVSAGVPSMVMWRISPRFSLMAVYTPVRNVETSFTFRPLPFVSLSAEGIWKVDGYSLAGRSDREEKLYHEYGIARLKVQSYVGRNASLYAAGGYRMVDMFFTSKRSTRREHVRECPRSTCAEFGASAFM